MTIRPASEFYFPRAVELLQRHLPGADTTLNPEEELLLRYMWSSPPSERAAEYSDVGGGVGFGVAMLVLFERMHIVPADVDYIQSLELAAAATLMVDLGTTPEDLVPALHARLLSMAKEGELRPALEDAPVFNGSIVQSR